jgi:uncharacterized protein (DUF1330 family)
MPAYVIGEVDIIKPDQIKRYSGMVAAAVDKYGGRYLARGATPQVLEGGPAHRILVIEFPTVEQAQTWFASPEYAEAKAVRQGASNLRLILIEGK